MDKAKQDSLEQIRADILSQNICPDLAKTAIKLVFGDGNPKANVVFIGEAPGKKEDELGLPFVGSAGKLLDEMLESNGLDRKDVYITNIVKYRPPNNRDPFPEEKEAFKPFLYRQLNVINPKLTIFLGRHSMNCFFPDLKISEVHGRQIKDGMGRSYLALYHPAAALYNGGMRKVLFEDFAKIPQLLNENQ